MTLFRNKYRVETTRLRGWDYSQDGFYFVTICTNNRDCLFGEIVDDIMYLNDFGKIVNDCWFDLPNHYSNIILDAFCIMPNHIHGIIVIDNPPDGTMGSGIVVETGFKPVSTVESTEPGIVETGLKPVSTVESTELGIVETGFKPVSTVESTEPGIVETGLKPVSTIGSTSSGNQHHGLFEFMRALKTFSARQINELRNTRGETVWQSRFYDHIIRNDESLERIREYILNNPKSWAEDIHFQKNQ